MRKLINSSKMCKWNDKTVSMGMRLKIKHVGQSTSEITISPYVFNTFENIIGLIILFSKEIKKNQQTPNKCAIVWKDLFRR